jgi:hypothetical protein
MVEGGLTEHWQADIWGESTWQGAQPVQRPGGRSCPGRIQSRVRQMKRSGSWWHKEHSTVPDV